MQKMTINALSLAMLALSCADTDRAPSMDGGADMGDISTMDSGNDSAQESACLAWMRDGGEPPCQPDEVCDLDGQCISSPVCAMSNDWCALYPVGTACEPSSGLCRSFDTGPSCIGWDCERGEVCNPATLECERAPSDGTCAEQWQCGHPFTCSSGLCSL